MRPRAWQYHLDVRIFAHISAGTFNIIHFVLLLGIEDKDAAGPRERGQGWLSGVGGWGGATVSMSGHLDGVRYGHSSRALVIVYNLLGW